MAFAALVPGAVPPEQRRRTVGDIEPGARLVDASPWERDMPIRSPKARNPAAPWENDEPASASSTPLVGRKQPFAEANDFLSVFGNLGQGVVQGIDEASALNQAFAEADREARAAAPGNIFLSPQQKAIRDRLFAEKQLAIRARFANANAPESTDSVLDEVAQGFGRILPNALMPGPAGALATGQQMQYERTADLRNQGVDAGTAERAGIISNAAAAAGGVLPAGVGGNFVTRAVTGAGTNAAIGAAERGAVNRGLREAGYEQQADMQQQAFDPAAVGVDALLGAFFGGIRPGDARAPQPPEPEVLRAQPVDDSPPPQLPAPPQRPALPSPDASATRPPPKANPTRTPRDQATPLYSASLKDAKTKEVRTVYFKPDGTDPSGNQLYREVDEGGRPIKGRRPRKAPANMEQLRGETPTTVVPGGAPILAESPEAVAARNAPPPPPAPPPAAPTRPDIRGFEPDPPPTVRGFEPDTPDPQFGRVPQRTPPDVRATAFDADPPGPAQQIRELEREVAAFEARASTPEDQARVSQARAGLAQARAALVGDTPAPTLRPIPDDNEAARVRRGDVDEAPNPSEAEAAAYQAGEADRRVEALRRAVNQNPTRQNRAALRQARADAAYYRALADDYAPRADVDPGMRAFEDRFEGTADPAARADAPTAEQAADLPTRAPAKARGEATPEAAERVRAARAQIEAEEAKGRGVSQPLPPGGQPFFERQRPRMFDDAPPKAPADMTDAELQNRIDNLDRIIGNSAVTPATRERAQRQRDEAATELAARKPTPAPEAVKASDASAREKAMDKTAAARRQTIERLEAKAKLTEDERVKLDQLRKAEAAANRMRGGTQDSDRPFDLDDFYAKLKRAAPSGRAAPTRARIEDIADEVAAKYVRATDSSARQSMEREAAKMVARSNSDPTAPYFTDKEWNQIGKLLDDAYARVVLMDEDLTGSGIDPYGGPKERAARGAPDIKNVTPRDGGSTLYSNPLDPKLMQRLFSKRARGDTLTPEERKFLDDAEAPSSKVRGRTLDELQVESAPQPGDTVRMVERRAAILGALRRVSPADMAKLMRDWHGHKAKADQYKMALKMARRVADDYLAGRDTRSPQDIAADFGVSLATMDRFIAQATGQQGVDVVSRIRDLAEDGAFPNAIADELNMDVADVRRIMNENQISRVSDPEALRRRQNTTNANPLGEVGAAAVNLARTAARRLFESDPDRLAFWTDVAAGAKKLTFKNVLQGTTNFTSFLTNASAGALNMIARRHAKIAGADADTAKVLGIKEGDNVLEWIARQLGTDPGSGKMQPQHLAAAVKQNAARYINKIRPALFGLSPEQGKKVVELVTNGPIWSAENLKPADQRFKTPPKGVDTATWEQAVALRKWFDSIWNEAKDAGLKLGKRDGYFPRVLDEEAVMNNRDGFIDAATKAYLDSGMNAKDAAQAARDWFFAVAYPSQRALNPALVFDPATSALNKRKLPASADVHMADFYVRDVAPLVARYAARMAEEIENARRFGPGDEKLDAAFKHLVTRIPKGDLEQFMGQVTAARGSLTGSPLPGILRPFVAVSDALGMMALLGRTGLLQVFEPFNIGIRANENLAKSAARVLDQFRFFADRRKDAREAKYLADLIGVTGEFASRMMVDARLDGIDSALVRRMTSNFMDAIGVTKLTMGQRAYAVRVADITLRRAMEHVVEGKGTAASARELLKEFGIDDAAAKKILAFYDETADAGMGERSQRIAYDDTPEMRAYRGALYDFAVRSIQEPDAASMPFLAKNPWARPAYAITGFMYAYTREIRNRSAKLFVKALDPRQDLTVADRAKLANPLLSYAVVGAGAATMIQAIMEEVFGGKRDEPQTFTEWAVSVADRAGAFGTWSAFLNMFVFNLRYERDPTTMAAGAYRAAQLQAVGKIAAAAPWNQRNSDETNTKEWTAVKAGYRFGVAPLAAAAVAAVPVPAILAPVRAGAIAYGTSSQAGDAAANTVVGPKSSGRESYEEDTGDDFGYDMGVDYEDGQ